MKIAARQLPAFLTNAPKEVRAVLVYGQNEGLVKAHAKTLGTLIAPDLSDPFNVVQMTADSIKESPARFFDEAAAMSLMGGQRLLRIEDGNDGITAYLKEYLENPSPDCFIVVETGELKGTSSLRKLFEGHKNAAAVACYMEEQRNVGAKIRDICQHAGYGIDRDAQLILSSALAGDTGLLVSELQKLLTYKGLDPNFDGFQGEPLRKKIGDITLDDIFACNPNMRSYSLDEMINAAALGQASLAYNITQKVLLEGVPGIVILRALQRHFRRLYITTARMRDGESQMEAVKALRPPLFFKYENEFNAQLRKWPMARLEAVLTNIAQAESRSKQSGENAETLCAHLILGIARAAA